MDCSKPKLWALPVVKIKAGETREFIIESDTPAIFSTHYANGPFLCPGYPCPLCYLTSRRSSVFQIVSTANDLDRRVYLLELPAHVWSEINFFALAEFGRNPMRGDLVSLTRRSRRSALKTDVLQHPGPNTDLRHTSYVAQVVARLYKLEPPEQDQALESWFETLKPVLTKRAEIAAQRHASTDCAS